MSPKRPPKRVLLLTHARIASHFLERMLSAQPNAVYASGPFGLGAVHLMKSTGYPFSSDDLHEVYGQLLEAQQAGFTDIWEPFFANAEKQGKIAFMHSHLHFSLQPALASAYILGNRDPGNFEPIVFKSTTGDNKHSHDNPELLPDAELLAAGTVPLVTIRRPRLMMPSIYRTLHDMAKFDFFNDPADEVFKFTCTLHWQRLIYDWHTKHGPSHGIKPLIVDADDYQGAQHKAFITRLCNEIGLDDASVLYTWPKASEAELSASQPLWWTLRNPS